MTEPKRQSEPPSLETRRRLTRNAPAAVGRKPSRKTEVVQGRILDAAAKVFAAKGYQLAKLKDIADRVGVHVTALRYHFPTKDVLVEEMMNTQVIYVYACMQQAVAALAPGTSCREKIRTAARAYMAATVEKADYISAHSNVINQVPPALRRRHFVHLKRSNDFWRDLVVEAYGEGTIRRDLDVSVANQVLMGALIWTREWYKPGGRYSPEALGDMILAILFDGLAPDDQRAAASGEK